MNARATSRLMRWWAHGLDVVEEARPLMADHTARAIALGATREEFTAALVARAWRWTARQLGRLHAQPQPQTSQELLAHARSIEQTMPNLAAELRFFASNSNSNN
jgi:hypothetical protein